MVDDDGDGWGEGVEGDDDLIGELKLIPIESTFAGDDITSLPASCNLFSSRSLTDMRLGVEALTPTRADKGITLLLVVDRPS